MSAVQDLWTDRELRDLIREKPELVAIADALSCAHMSDVVVGRRRRSRRWQFAVLAAALAAVAAIALVAPWSRSGGGSLSSLALAAIGSQPVLHVVSELPGRARLIDIQSGAVEPVTGEEQEIWYDPKRGLKHTITRADSTVTGDVLETPAGGFTPGGFVYDCAWIAAHPVEATKAGVSCNASGENGTTTRTIPRPKPTLVPGLGGFLDGYQHALAEGRAREAGTGELNGRPVVWLELALAEGGTERVALDKDSHKPLLIEDSTGWRLRILSIETLPTDAANFRRPRTNESTEEPSYGSTVEHETLPLDRAALATALIGALWAGPTLSGLPLASAEHQDLRTGFANDSRPPQLADGLELIYGSLTANGKLARGRPYVQLRESRTRQFGYAWGFVRGEPPEAGMLYAPTMGEGSASAIGFTVVQGTYVTIDASSPELLLLAARSLRPA